MSIWKNLYLGFDPVFCFAADPVLPLYQRLLANGKAKKLALTVLMRKLVILANRLLKNPHFALAT